MQRLFAMTLAFLALAFAPRTASAETRVALVIGNSDYAHTSVLENPLADATDLAAALKGLGFEVLLATNAEKRQLDKILRTYIDKIATADVALFFYAGHGLQVGLQNFLVPVDAKLERERDLEFEAVKLEFILRQMELDREGKTSIVILDACRDNTLSRNLARSMGTRSTAIGQGLAATTSGLGTFIAYATQPGNVALDGAGSRNSPFTSALIRHMGVKGRNLPATMIEVRKDVVTATRGRQVPWDHSSLTGDFQFVPDTAKSVVAPSTPGNSADVAALQERLRKLEDDAKSRETTKPPAISLSAYKFGTYPGSSLEGTEIAAPPSTANCESRCKTQTSCIGYNLSQDGVCQLFEKIARRVENPQSRAGIRSDQFIPTLTSANTVPVPAVLPRNIKEPSKLTREERVRIDGNVISEGRQPNADACQTQCDATAGCIGYQHGIKAPNMGKCQLFDRIDRRQEDANWRSGVVAAAPATTGNAVPPQGSQALVPPELLFSTLRRETERGFTIYTGAALTGEVIKTSGADSHMACSTVCRNTPGCVGATYKRTGRGFNESCTVLRTLTSANITDREATALIRAD